VTVEPCRWCGVDLIVAPSSESGVLLTLEEPPFADPRARLIAFNPATGLCRPLGEDDMSRARHWAYHGVTFHREHIVCPRSPLGRQRPTTRDVERGEQLVEERGWG
jgi:hypothetical protein